jgi:hypothetical protein
MEGDMSKANKNWGDHMSLIEKRIENLIKVMKDAKDYDMKIIWNNKLQQLFDRRKTKAYERLEDQARMVH